MKTLRTIFFAAAMLCALTIGSFGLTADANAAGRNSVVVMETSMGKVMIMLYADKTPVTVENFLKYVDAGFYTNLIFHRIVKTKKDARKRLLTNMDIVQGGGYTYPIKRIRPLFPPIVNEAATGLPNSAGTIAMARATDPNSATCEFFFNVQDNPEFNYVPGAGWGTNKAPKNPGYCAFGKVIRGMDVVQKMLNVETTTMGRMADIPAKPIFIKKVYRAN